MRSRSGFTLVEMLVVIFVILAVTALAIGIVAPDTQARRMRETARQVGAFLQGAKALAAQSGHPVAVIIQPDAGEYRLGRTLKYAEVPPPYGGDTIYSVAVVTSIFLTDTSQPLSDSNPQAATIELRASAAVTTLDSGWLNSSDPALDLIHAGDVIRFNYQGHYYPVIAVNRGAGVLTIRAADMTNLIRLQQNLAMSYQVTRQPTPSAAPDLELPESVVIDLGKSGPEGSRFASDAIAAPPYPFSPALPIVIVFSPGGGVPSYLVGGQLRAASSPLYLLVGKVEKAALTLADVDNNIIDFQSYWVAVNNQTGLVSTAENAGVRGVDPNPLNESRDFVRKALSTGSR